VSVKSFLPFCLFFLSSSLFLLLHIVPIQPSRLCRHPSIRTLC
jgi:hypothetical protein